MNNFTNRPNYPPSSEEQVMQWYNSAPVIGLLSTSSNVIPYSGILYNVSGSTHDPEKVKGCINCSWIDLLEKEIPGAKAEYCYVENSDASSKTSHFKTGKNNVIGGHMTKDIDGHVDTGGTSYLMPLCAWDNNPVRNRTPFQVTNRRIVELGGYMLGEPYVTFAARAPVVGDNRIGLIYFDETEEIWMQENVTAKYAESLSRKDQNGLNRFILVEKSKKNNGECRIVDSNI